MLNNFAPPPHVLVYLYADPHVLAERLASRRGIQAYEQPTILSKVMESYRENVLQRLPETCSPRRDPWAKHLESLGIYPEDQCYPQIVEVDTGAANIEETQEKIWRSIKPHIEETCSLQRV
jgi:hypothetical protein